MKEKILIIKIIILILIIFIMFFSLNYFKINLTGKAIKETQNYYHSYTKAICNETHCQDFEIKCYGNKLLNKTALTKPFLQSINWTDLRNKTKIERLCN